MSQSREEFIQMLVNIDDYISGDKESDSTRVINQVKVGLHTCSELLVWIQIIKSKYVISRSVKIASYCLFFGSLSLGIGLFLLDIVTDIIVNYDWRIFAQDDFSIAIFCEKLNKQDLIKTSIHIIVEACWNTTNTFEDILNCAFERKNVISEELEPCPYEKESKRFSSTEWLTLSNITLFHIVFPWILFTLSFCLMNFDKKRSNSFCGCVFFIFNIILSPISTKFNVFLERIRHIYSQVTMQPL